MSDTSMRTLAAIFLFASAVPVRAYLRGGDSGSEASATPSAARVVGAASLELSLVSSLEEVLHAGEGIGKGESGTSARRTATIEAGIWQTFQALPKNMFGRLAPRSVRYLVHNYFAKEHGWLINGLENHGARVNVTELHEASILQDKAPAFVEALLEMRHSDHGLSLSDVVAMIVALERLILDESVRLLEAAYGLNNQSPATSVSEEALHDILVSYLVVFQKGMSADLVDVEKHWALKRRKAKIGTLAPVIDFERDTLLNSEFARRHRINPFKPKQYSFEATSGIVEDMMQTYGRWQNTDCRNMKETLMDLAGDESGRVTLGTFYSQPRTATYRFTESSDYLRQIGALDESGSGAPKVLIANYMSGPSNCIASSSYYSVCCLSDCEGLMNEIEAHVQAPATSPGRILDIVSNLSSASVEAPRQLSEDLVQKLHSVAVLHKGEVPLHGRLFAQWLHFAFPNDCPFPSAPQSAKALSAGHWRGGKHQAPDSEKEYHIEAARSQAARVSEESSFSQWNDDEVLPLQEGPRRAHGWLAAAGRVVAQLTLFLVVVRIVVARWCTTIGSDDGKFKHSKIPVYL